MYGGYLLCPLYPLLYDVYYHSMNSCTEYLFMKLCKLHLNAKKTHILFGIIAGSFFSFVLANSNINYKVLFIILSNTERFWLCSVLLQQATRSNALTNAKRHARKKFFYLLLECSTYNRNWEHSQGFFICFMINNQFNSPRLIKQKKTFSVFT